MCRDDVRNGNWFFDISITQFNDWSYRKVGLVWGEPSSNHTSYLVDPASSHMLVSKTKPCMSKFKRFKQRDCGRLIISVIVYLMVDYYKDNRSNSRANTCTPKQFSVCTY